MDKDLSINLFKDISSLIESTKSQVSKAVNSTLVLLYWKIGERIYKEILSEERAGYGEKIIKELAYQLGSNYGKGFDARSLFRMVRFAKFFPDEKIVVTLSPLLSWSHFIELISLEDDLKRKFYT